MGTNIDQIQFDGHATKDETTKISVGAFLDRIKTLETINSTPTVIFQDGVSGSYYIKASLPASEAAKMLDFDAKLNIENPESFRANRELMLRNRTFKKMQEDAQKGREFNDIIVEFNVDYAPSTPLKVWGGQHRSRAIKLASDVNRYHGFRIYFNLTKDQRTDLALVSNTSISVSNDTFDRLLEETYFGDSLRRWCQKVGFLNESEDFPDVGSRSDKITVKKARSFVANFYLGKEVGSSLMPTELDKKIYEPHLVETGPSTDNVYEKLARKEDIFNDTKLVDAGKKFFALHNAQRKAVENSASPIKNIKMHRNKALVDSVLCGWSYVAGLLQEHEERLANHYTIPKISGKIPDPLNAEEMSKFKHDSDAPTYRGLATRSDLKDRHRVAQVFLAKSLEKSCTFEKRFLNRAVSQVVGLLTLKKGCGGNG